MHRFIGREQELAELARRWDSGRAELLVVYGRRRVGKTELLLQFARRGSKRYLYFLATQVTRQEQLRQFSEVLRDAFSDPLLKTLTFSDWDAVFAYLGQQVRQERLLVILDEFPYLCEAAPELPSVIQRFWDLEGQHSRLFLVLCGSRPGFMEREVLGERSPLYGRRTGQLRLQPLDYREAGQFFAGYGWRDRLLAYGMLGGMPAYLQRFEPKQSLRKNLLQEMLSAQRYLYEEPRFLLRMELRDVRVYASILGAIASGCTRLNEIAQRVGVAAHAVSKYLSVLQELGLIARAVPFLARAPQRSKQGRYHILDPFLRFWYRFVYPHATLVEAGQGELVYERFIRPQLDTYMGGIFEEVARAYMERYAAAELKVPPVVRTGREWAGDFDLDLMAEHADGSWTIGECKWTRRPVGVEVLRELRSRWERLGRRQRLPERVRYFIFSSGGFAPGLLGQQDGAIRLLGLAEIFGEVGSTS